MSDETRLIHAGKTGGALAKTVGPPIQKGSTVLLPNAEALYDDANHVTYGRGGLAAQACLQEALAVLEGAVGVSLYPSGIAAISGALMALLKAGDEILVVDNVYKPVRRFCDQVLKRFGVTVIYFDPHTPPETLVTTASDAVRLILLESPGSLSFEMQDVPRIAELARERGILTAIDNTWAAGLLFKPLAHGVDPSLPALTKHVGGHSDVFMGSVAARDPALPSFSDHALWARDFPGPCGLSGFVLRPAPEAAVNAFLDALKLFGLGFSWGGFESLAISCDPQLHVRRFATDYGGPLTRLHVGLEDPEDLIADLRRGLDAYAKLAA